MSLTLSILMVTRERSEDRLYGLGRSLQPIVEALTSKGHRVRYLCQEDLHERDFKWRDHFLSWCHQWPYFSHHADREALLGAFVERFQMGFLARSIASSEGFTRIHFHDPWMAFGFWIAKNIRFTRGLRWGMTEHGFGSYYKATELDGLVQSPRTKIWLQKLERFILDRSDWVIAPTQLALNQLVIDCGLPSQGAHWSVIPHPRPDFSPLDREQCRRALNVSPDDLVVLGVGRVVPLKRFDRLLEACFQLRDRIPSLRLVILGGGDHSSLQALAQSVGFKPLILEVCENIQPWLVAADVYVSCSKSESFGLANLEALAQGLPCVCTDVGGVPEVLGDGAELMPASLDGLVSCLEALLLSPERRTTWSKKALDRATTWPKADEIADAYEAIYLA